MRQGIAMIVSAPSAAGKSTLINRLLARYPEIGFSVSCTTRSMRPGEIEGKDYFFVDEAEFEKMRLAGQFAEWAKVHDHFYGTPLQPVLTMQKEGRDVLFDIDVQGAARLKATLPNATFVFIAPPNMAELRRRMENRGYDDEKYIALRLANAAKELGEAFWYDAIIVNADLDTATAELDAVYRAATLSPRLHRELLTNLLESVE